MSREEYRTQRCLKVSDGTLYVAVCNCADNTYIDPLKIETNTSAMGSFNRHLAYKTIKQVMERP